MRFSSRTAWEAGENEWAAAQRAAREAGRELIDLTVSNPTACGLAPAGADLLLPLADPGALRYVPDPFGMEPARAAVAGYYSELGASVPLDRICLTTSTSEAYGFLFRLLCDPGDEVLIARPSYPLFDLLAQLDDVVLKGYPLHYEPGALASGSAGWSIDLDAVEEAIGPRTRAIVVVHPNNPTGSYVSAEERAALQATCAKHGMALIVDEVFLDYALGGSGERVGAVTFASGQAECLCFVLSGLSKVCALPQMKLSWIAARGPEALVNEAMQRLEVIADTFLSVNAPTQFALPYWLEGRSATQSRVRERMAGNLALLDQVLRGSMADRFSVQGGWTVVLRVPAAVGGLEFALAAIARGVLVQPGSFYGFPPGRCVLSLLTPPEVWERGLRLLPI